MPLTELFLRLTLSFIALLTLTRFIGRKEIAQMTYVNFVSAIAIGTLGASLAVDNGLGIWKGLLALAAWTAFTIAVGLLDVKSRKARILLEGQPKIVIRNGRILEDELRNARLDVDTLTMLLRKKNIFSPADVDYAIFETDGSLSVLRKEPPPSSPAADPNRSGRPGTPASPAARAPATAVIADGQVLAGNLRQLQLDEAWLHAQLQARGVHRLSEVFYAEVHADGSLYVDKRNDQPNEAPENGPAPRPPGSERPSR
jgi:uncharacterized membrane protein YcaP (DUF421 family)